MPRHLPDQFIIITQYQLVRIIRYQLKDQAILLQSHNTLDVGI